jgi:hypothetical protein
MPDLQRITLGPLEIVDARERFPPSGSVARPRDPAALLGVAIHHDAGAMAAGDLNYSGDTLDEDLTRLQLLYRIGLDRGWGGLPYHFVASPNGRCFYTTDWHLFGAQVAGRNHQLVGVALMGNFLSSTPGDLQLCAAGRALIYLWQQTGRLLDQKAHKEWALPSSPTQCPGDTWTTWQWRLLNLTVAAARLAFPA